MGVWSAHFDSAFQDDDIHTIVKNRAIQDPANIPHFFTRPLLFADQPEYAQYRPLALLSLAGDYALAGGANARIFAVDSFAWFLLETLLFLCVCRLLFGANWYLCGFAVALFLFHPVTGETLNYASHRGDILGSVGLLAALAFRITWPTRMPATIMSWQGVPKTDWDDRRRRWTPKVNAAYKRLLGAPPIPDLLLLLFALPADPDVAVYPLILLAYISMFDNGPGRKAPWRRVLPAAIVCISFEAAQLSLTWKYGTGYRMPALSYWFTQPWVVVRYIGDFLVPVRLTPDSGLAVFEHFWSPLAMAGYAGLAVVVYAAIRLGKREEWRFAAFGIWWFLIALLPSAAIPHRMAESDTRMYLPMLGLAIAGAASGERFCAWLLQRSPNRTRTNLIAGAVALTVIAGLCVLTFQRNQVWTSELAFRQDVADKNPGNGVAFIQLAIAKGASGEPAEGYKALLHGEELIAAAGRRDAPDEVRLARAFDLWNVDKDAEKHFKLAVAADPAYGPAWSAYSQWLLVRQRGREAYEAAKNALKASPWNTEAQHTLLQFYSDNSDWAALKKTANEVLAADATDADAKRSLSVVQAMGEEVTAAEQKAKSEPSVDDFLALSVRYYRARRFEDSIKACKEAIQLRPDVAEAYSNMAAASYALGRPDDSIAALREALKIRPDLAVVRSNLNFLLSQKGEQPDPARPGK